MTKNYLLIFLLLLFTIGLYSQVEIIGEIKLGDTTQVHHLITKKGDRFVGRIIGFDDQNIQFLMLGNKLSFSLTAIDHIEVQREREQLQELPKEVFAFNYKINTKTDVVYFANFQSFRNKKIVLKTKDEKTVTYPIDEIKSIEWLTDSIDNDSTYTPKYHKVKLNQRAYLLGQITSYKNEKWELKVIDNQLLSFNNKQLYRIDYILEDKPVSIDNDLSPGLSKYGNYPMRRFTKNFIAPTGFMLSTGETEYRNTEIFYNNLEYGVSDNFTIGTSIATLFLVNSLGLKAKVGANILPKFHIAAGGQLLHTFGADVDNFTLTNYFAAFTLGTHANNLSASIGRAANIDGENLSNFTLSGSIRTGKRGRLFAEYNRFIEAEFNDNYLIFNAGGSWFNENNRVDFGVAIYGDEYEIVPLPIAAFSHYF